MSLDNAQPDTSTYNKFLLHTFALKCVIVCTLHVYTMKVHMTLSITIITVTWALHHCQLHTLYLHDDYAYSTLLIMAAKYEFVEALPEEYKCSWCKNAIYGAVETKCCGYLLCESCSKKGRKKCCPLCEATCIETQDNVYMRRKLDQLHIYCVNKNYSSITLKGCDWKGAINDLKSHLDNHCPHTKVTCSYKCDVKIARCMKKAHEGIFCSNRPVTCPYCKKQTTAQTIDSHVPKCDKRPIECPNKCSAKLVKDELQFHLKQCPLQKISCEFEHAGCEEKVLRKDYDSHIKNNAHKHLKLLSCSFSTMLTDIEQTKGDMDDMKANSDKELKALEKQAIAKTDKQIKEMDKVVIGLKQELGKTQQRIHILSQQHLESMKTITIPFVFNSTSSSAPMYILGYCMSINIEKTTNVVLVLHPGQYDSDLLWPIQGVVKLLLLHPKHQGSNDVIVLNDLRNPQLELVYSLAKTLRPTGCEILGIQVVKNTIPYLHGIVSKEYHLLVKGAVFH